MFARDCRLVELNLDVPLASVFILVDILEIVLIYTASDMTALKFQLKLFETEPYSV